MMLSRIFHLYHRTRHHGCSLENRAVIGQTFLPMAEWKPAQVRLEPTTAALVRGPWAIVLRKHPNRLIKAYHHGHYSSQCL